MPSDSIPGLNKIGEVKAAEKFKGARLSELKKKVIHLWQTNSHGIQQNDPDTAYVTNRQKVARMFQSANCLILRTNEEELRELTREEILEIMTWDHKHDPIIDATFEMIRMGVYSLSPASYTAGLVSKEDKVREGRVTQVQIKEEIAQKIRPPTEEKDWYKEVVNRKVRYNTSVASSRMPKSDGYRLEDKGKKRVSGHVEKEEASRAKLRRSGVV
jgi:hypothetical protein